MLENRINALQNVEAYIGTFFSKEYVLKKVLRMNDTEIQHMRDQIKKEADTDPLDGGIVIPPGGDGIQRYPSHAEGNRVAPEMDATDRVNKELGVDNGNGEAPPKDDEEDEDEFLDNKEFHVKKGRKK